MPDLPASCLRQGLTEAAALEEEAAATCGGGLPATSPHQCGQSPQGWRDLALIFKAGGHLRDASQESTDALFKAGEYLRVDKRLEAHLKRDNRAEEYNLLQVGTVGPVFATKFILKELFNIESICWIVFYSSVVALCSHEDAGAPGMSVCADYTLHSIPDMVRVYFPAFMFAFETNRMLSRYFRIYYCAMSITDLVLQLVIRARMSIRDEGAIHDVWRFANLIHILGYVGLDTVYTMDNLVLPSIEAYGNREHGLLSATEVAELRTLSPERGETAYHFYVTKCLGVLSKCLDQGTLSGEAYQSMEPTLLDLRTKIARFYHHRGKFGILFQKIMYKAMTTVMVGTGLGEMGIVAGREFVVNTSGISAELYCVIMSVMAVSLVLIVWGLFRRVMYSVDPFRDDPIDLNVVTYVDKVLKSSTDILKRKYGECEYGEWREQKSPQNVNRDEREVTV